MAVNPPPPLVLVLDKITMSLLEVKTESNLVTASCSISLLNNLSHAQLCESVQLTVTVEGNHTA